MNAWRKNPLLALLEVILVRFGLIPLLALGVDRFFPNFPTWQTETLGFDFPVFIDLIFVGVSLLLIGLWGGDFKGWGLRFSPLKVHLDIFGTCFLPFVLASLPFGLGVDPARWGGALILALTQAALLWAVIWLTRKKPTLGAPILLGLLLPLVRVPTSGAPIGRAAAVFLTYAVFVGFGEEILYRGYLQSRLDQAFGTPWRIAGVPLGWGWALTSLIFGLSHVGLASALLGESSAGLTWAWGAWTAVGGLVFGFLRAKTGSILAPALLHGLPQALAAAALVLMG